MRISEIIHHKVAVPFREEEVWSFGRRAYLETILLELRTDEGLIGLGEAAGYPSTAVVEAAIESLKPLVLGEDPVQIEGMLKRMYILGTWHHVKGSNPAIGGLEMACWDIVGKICQQPIANLFGGRVRDEVEYFYYLSQKSPHEMAADALLGLAAKFNCFYIKVGSGDLALDVARVMAVREAVGPEAHIRVDANEAWSTAGALRALRLLEPANLELAEQPVLGSNLEEMAYLRGRISMPLLANEASWTRYSQLEVIKRSAADVISVDNQMDGGLLNLKRSAGLCEVAGLPVLKHSLGELGVATYAAAHVISTCSNFLYANQSYASFLVDDVLEGVTTLPYANGKLAVPTGDGIGVEIDREKLERYEENYARMEDSVGPTAMSFSAVWPRL
jgi:L-alanine-DL-glutamate epimerase-like enolase superfamily enzyme